MFDRDLERCQRSGKLSLEYDPQRGEKRCLWWACGYANLIPMGGREQT